jgi:phosphoribosyl-ATP pyrophosphohydrolase/phosphoribosyl-AMP cyclohydrolase
MKRIVTAGDAADLRFGADGLLPAIVQDAASGEVLMLAYMNAESLRLTFEGGEAVFWSRSRARLWRKGETSGNVLRVAEVLMDCDADTLLVLARPAGPVCHTGTATCFGDGPVAGAARFAFLGELEDIVADRIARGGEGSYTARLYASGLRRMAQKVGEEGLEVSLAAVAEDDDALVGEAADLLFHLLLLLKSRGLDLGRAVAELQSRHERQISSSGAGSRKL